MAKKDTSKVIPLIFTNGDIYKNARATTLDILGISGARPVKHSKLSDEDRKRFNECEQAIDKSQGRFESVVAYFMAIKAMNLFREEYDTFDDYCRKKHKLNMEDLTKQRPKKGRLSKK